MTFEEVKAEIIGRIKRVEICNAYPSLVNAANYSQLVAAGTGMFEWIYRTGIVDDALLDDFDASALNENYLYYNQTDTLNFGADYEAEDIFLIGGNLTINLSGSIRKRVFAYAGGNYIFNISDSAFLELRSHQSANIQINLVGNGSALLLGEKDTVFTITAEETSVVHGTVMDDASVIYTGSDSSYIVFRVLNHASMNYQLADLAEADIREFDSATVSTVLI